MKNIAEELAAFVKKTDFDALPDEVVHEMKRVFLDSIGCAINGLSTERGSIAIELARRLGGPSESTIIGTSAKVSCVNAAFANGELINALDYDSMSRGIHDVPTLIAAVLAVAESNSASGKDLILGTALSLEVSGRLRTAEAKRIPIASGPDRGSLQWPTVSGYSRATLAAAAGAGKILNLAPDKIANAIGISGCICPPNIGNKFFRTSPVRMSKYASSGWGAHTGVTSALLAEMGYLGDTSLFDGPYGFWRYTGQEEWDSGEVLTGIGTQWCCHRINYKQYPAGY